MNCPYCGEEMNAGYIQCRDCLTWNTKKRMVPAIPSLRSDAIVLDSSGYAFSGSTVIAHNCTKCNKIMIDYVK